MLLDCSPFFLQYLLHICCHTCTVREKNVQVKCMEGSLPKSFLWVHKDVSLGVLYPKSVRLGRGLHFCRRRGILQLLRLGRVLHLCRRPGIMLLLLLKAPEGCPCLCGKIRENVILPVPEFFAVFWIDVVERVAQWAGSVSSRQVLSHRQRIVRYRLAVQQFFIENRNTCAMIRG